MKSFHDIRLTAAVGSDAECEVAFRTDVVRTRAGAEYRNGLISQPRHGYRWSVARASTELEDLRQFHGARKGSKYAFRFKDPFDNTLPLTVISTGSAGTEFNIVKRYASGGSTFERRILLPDTSQTTVYVGTTALASSAWNITTAYQLHLNVAPGAGKSVSVQGVYDVPVRFDSGFSARLASPDADEVEVELTEARYSPPVTFSTGSTWGPSVCSISDYWICHLPLESPYGDNGLAITLKPLVVDLNVHSGSTKFRITACELLNSIQGGVPPFSYSIKRLGGSSMSGDDPKTIYVEFVPADLFAKFIRVKVSDVNTYTEVQAQVDIIDN